MCQLSWSTLNGPGRNWTTVERDLVRSPSAPRERDTGIWPKLRLGRVLVTGDVGSTALAGEVHHVSGPRMGTQLVAGHSTGGWALNWWLGPQLVAGQSSGGWAVGTTEVVRWTRE